MQNALYRDEAGDSRSPNHVCDPVNVITSPIGLKLLGVQNNAHVRYTVCTHVMSQ